MTGQVTTTNTTTEVVECVPNDVWVQTFQHLEPADLGSFAQVCTIFNTVIRQDAVWVGFPEDIQQEHRFRSTAITEEQWNSFSNEMLCMVFEHLDIFDLQLIGQVSKQFHAVANIGQLWNKYPNAPAMACRFSINWISRMEWRKEGVTCLEKRIIGFIQRNPIPGRVSCCEIRFPNCPDAKIAFWMGNGVRARIASWGTPGYDGGDIMCSPDLVTKEQYFVLGNACAYRTHNDGSQSRYALCPERPGHEDRDSLPSNYYGHPEHQNNKDQWDDYPLYERRYLPIQLCRSVYPSFSFADYLPNRWFCGNHSHVQNWTYAEPFGCNDLATIDAIWKDNSTTRIYEAAQKRMYELDVRTITNAASIAVGVIAIAAQYFIG